jgi:hypothetical protein
MNSTADDKLLADLRAKVLEARARDEAEVPLVQPPATPEMIAATEARLGRPLHPFLKRVYAEVANGGFGPGYGLLRLGTPDGPPDEESLSSEFESGRWPENLLPLWNWGCAAWSCLDVTSPEGIIVTHDDVDGPTVTDFIIRSWLRAWVDGINLWKEIYEDKDAIVTNPFTHQPMVTKVRGRAKGRKD